MRVTVLGSGTLIPDDRRRSAAHLVEVGDLRLLLDCGAGTVHGFDRHGVEWRRLTHVALSHFHTDHVGDVAALLFCLKWGIRPPRDAPLTVLGPPGLRRFMDDLERAFGDSVSDPGFPVRLIEVPRDGSWEDPAGPVRLRAHPTPHTDASVAWRVEGGGGALGYTGDTGPSPLLGGFLADVDLLISECSFPDPPPMEAHLTPRGVAELARRADPGLVLLTHIYPFLDPAAAPELVRGAGFTGRVVTAWDGTRVEMTGEGVRILDSTVPTGSDATTEPHPGTGRGEGRRET